MSDDLKDAADGVAGAQGLVYFSFHALFSVGVGAVEQHFLPAMQLLQLLPWDFSVWQRGLAHSDDVAEHFNAKFAQKKFGDGADGDAGGGFAGGGAFKNVSCFRKIVFERAGKVGMAGARRGDALVLLRITGFDGQ